MSKWHDNWGRELRWGLVIAGGITAAILAVVFQQHWLSTHTGVCAAGTSGCNPVWYNFWSGIGSDIGELAIVGGLITIVRHHNCHVHGCWRLCRFPLEGTPYKVCPFHHPKVPSNRRDRTVEEIVSSSCPMAMPRPRTREPLP